MGITGAYILILQMTKLTSIVKTKVFTQFFYTFNQPKILFSEKNHNKDLRSA